MTNPRTEGRYLTDELGWVEQRLERVRASSDITEAFYVNCIRCGITNGRPGLVGGYQTKAEAIARWNTRA